LEIAMPWRILFEGQTQFNERALASLERHR
jgi:hypothetical protein